EAAPEAVAGARGVQPIAAARWGGADGLRREARAPADAVTGARRAAGRLRLRHAHPVRIRGAHVDRPAGADACLLAAGHARALAGDVAADAVGAEARLAVAVLRADGAVRFGPAAAVHA